MCRHHSSRPLPYIFIPAKVAAFTAKRPRGHLGYGYYVCYLDSEDIQPFDTSSSRISGIMAYPPPMVNSPILKNEKSICKKHHFASPAFLSFKSVYIIPINIPARIIITGCIEKISAVKNARHAIIHPNTPFDCPAFPSLNYSLNEQSHDCHTDSFERRVYIGVFTEFYIEKRNDAESTISEGRAKPEHSEQSTL